MIVQPAAERLHLRRGPFRIWRSYPGRHVSDDTGLGPIGAVDYAELLPGLLVPMHEHRDDEIVSYLREGEMTHVDSAGRREVISAQRLMVMNAGAGFSHEESIPADGAPVRMLQIFLRPYKASLPPGVQFAPLEPRVSDGRWRLVAGPEGVGAPAWVRSDVLVLDAALGAGVALDVPAREGHGWWLYVMRGGARVGEHRLSAGDSLACVAGDAAGIEGVEAAALVLFMYARSARFTDRGSLSGRRG